MRIDIYSRAHNNDAHRIHPRMQEMGEMGNQADSAATLGQSKSETYADPCDCDEKGCKHPGSAGCQNEQNAPSPTTAQAMRPVDGRKLFRFLSLGAGVQSSRLLLEAAKGMRPAFDAAGFADTQREPAEVYEWLEWLKQEVARSPVPIPIYTATAGDLGREALRLRTSAKTGNTYLRTLIPAYVAKPDGSKAMMGRRCTTDYKIRVLNAMQRKLAEVPRGCKTPWVEVTVGISLDEWQRVKANREPWAVNAHPLVDERIDRHACEEWIFRHYQRRAPKSACRECPFHSDEQWAHMKAFQPDDFAIAVQYDRDLRNTARLQTGSAKLCGDVYLHSSLRPLDEVEFSTVPERFQIDLFGQHECEGLCGV